MSIADTPFEELLETGAAWGVDLGVLALQLRRSREAVLDQQVVGGIDSLLSQLEALDPTDGEARQRTELAVREFCYRHGLLSVLALSGMPLVYDLRRSYEENLAGPWATLPDVDPTERTQLERILGVDIHYPIGVAASALTATARYIEFYARHGFNVLTYKTVRTRSTPPHPFPNWVYVDWPSEPTNWEDLVDAQVIGDRDTYLRDPAAYSMANSFGVPSPPPEVWQEDVRRSVDILGPGKLLIVSVIGTAEGHDVRQLADDFALAASLAADAGAHAVELNLSCPNTVDYTGTGMEPPISESPEITREVVTAVRERVGASVRLVAKLGYLPKPALHGLLARLVDELDAVSGINTVPVRVVDSQGSPTFCGVAGDPHRDRTHAGLSGVAIRGLSQDFVRSLSELRREHAWDLQIIGMGGVMTPDDVRTLRALGADAVQTATTASHNPHLPSQVVAMERDSLSETEVVERVTDALNDPRWKYRTVEGLAEDTGVDPAIVRGVLERHPDLVRRTNLKDPRGREVLVPSERSRSGKELLADLRQILTS